MPENLIADGTQNSLSDVDIIITGDINKDAMIEKIYSLENKFQREINYHIYSEKEFIAKRREDIKKQIHNNINAQSGIIAPKRL